MLALMLLGGSGAPPAAAASPRPGLVSLDLRTHEEHVFPTGDLAALSPEGRRIAVAESLDNDEYRLRVRRLDGTHDRVLVQTPFPVFMGDPRWSPDGRTIAYLRLDPTCATGPPACHAAVQLWLVRPAGGSPRLLSDDAGTAAWGPDSQRLAFPGELDGAGLARLTLQNRDCSGRTAFGGRGSIYSLSWSGDGPRLVYSTNSRYFQDRNPGEIHSVDVGTGRDRVVAAGVDPASSHDGRFLSLVQRKGNRRRLCLLRNGELRVILGGPSFGFAHAWSRKGHLLAFAATNRFGQARVFVYDPELRKPLRAVTSWTYGPVPSITWSPDGRRLLFVRTRG